MSNSFAVFLALILIFINAFFVGAEFAVVSVRLEQVQPLAERKKIGSKSAMYALEHASTMLACTQLGITLASTALGVVAEPAIAHYIEELLSIFNISAVYSHPIALLIALTFVVFMHVVFGEIIPKNISVSMPDKLILILSPALVTISKLFGPIVIFLDKISNSFITVLGFEPKSEFTNSYSIEELSSILENSKAEGIIEDQGNLLTYALDFSAHTTDTVMVSRQKLYCLKMPLRPVDIEEAVTHTGFSRFPVLTEDDNFESYIHLKDILYAKDEDRFEEIPYWRFRPFTTVAPKDDIKETLKKMQVSGSHLASVVEDGNVIGVVFLEDILEELVGEVKDIMQREDLVK